MDIPLIGLTWEMGHVSDTLQSNLRFSHQIIQLLSSCLAFCLRGSVCTFCATEDLGYFFLFPGILSLVDMSVCL